MPLSKKTQLAPQKPFTDITVDSGIPQKPAAPPQWLEQIRETLFKARSIPCTAENIDKIIESYSAITQSYRATVSSSFIPESDLQQSLQRICEDIGNIIGLSEIPLPKRTLLKDLVINTFEANVKHTPSLLETVGAESVSNFCYILASSPGLRDQAYHVAIKYSPTDSTKSSITPVVARLTRIAEIICQVDNDKPSLSQECLQKALDITSKLPNPSWNFFDRVRYKWMRPPPTRDMTEMLTAQTKISNAMLIASKFIDTKELELQKIGQSAKALITAILKLVPKRSSYKSNLSLLGDIKHVRHMESQKSTTTWGDRPSMIG
jgi:hypothetical protein